MRTPPPEADPLTVAPRVLLLTSGATFVALDATCAREVAPLPAPVRLPGAPPFVSGVVNARGTLLPLVDLGSLFTGGPALRSGWMVVIERAGRQFAIAVDALPVLAAADAPPGESGNGTAHLPTEVCVADVALPMLDVDALADDFLISQDHATVRGTPPRVVGE